MRALVYGIRPDPQPEPDDDNTLLRGLARAPMRLQEVDDPVLLGPDWVVLRPRLTGICGSDAKQVFMDFGEDVARLEEWREAFTALATQDQSGAIKVAFDFRSS